MKQVISEKEQREIENILLKNKNNKKVFNFFKQLFNDAYKFSMTALNEKENYNINIYWYFSYLIIKNKKLTGKLNEEKIEDFKSKILQTFDDENYMVKIDDKTLTNLFELANTIKLPDTMINKIYEILFEKNILISNLDIAFNPDLELNKTLNNSLNTQFDYFEKKYNMENASRYNVIYEADNKKLFDEEVDEKFQSDVTYLRTLYESNENNYNLEEEKTEKRGLKK